MANELVVGHQSGNNIYAVIWRKSDNKVWDVGDSDFEPADTWNAARIAECAVDLTDRGGGFYSEDLPSGITSEGTYRAMYYKRAGAAPATTDRFLSGHTISWTGTSETTAPSAGSGKTLADLKGMCYYHGWNNTTTDGVSALIRFINNTLSMLAALAPWPEYHKRDGRITLADDDDDYICTNNSDEIITNISKLGNIIRGNRFVPLEEIPDGIEGWVHLKNTQGWSGAPTRYALRKYIEDGLVRMELLVYPCPGSGEDGTFLYYPYRLLPAELALDTDETDWPNSRLWLLEEALEKRLASSKRDRMGVALESPEFMEMVNRALVDSNPSYMPMRLDSPVLARSLSIREIIPVITP